ncbi:hypothetical protein HDU81_004393 [Chytriomyces hyalinus]|nr:hypothetical protein HDU81_004393 [Chytriomyces hyalinus]
MEPESLAGQIGHFTNHAASTSGGDPEDLSKNDPMQWEPTDAESVVAPINANVVHSGIVFKPRSLLVHTFANRYKPSKISQRDVSWLYVTDETGKQNIPPATAEGLLQRAIESASQVLEAHSKALTYLDTRDHTSKAAILETCRNKLLRIANHHQQTCGKWLIFCQDQSVDAVWAQVAAEVVAGNLGCTAKVSPSEGHGRMHVVCVYVGNCFDIADVRRVYDRLTALGLSRLTFKMDLFTHLGIASKNKWELSPCLYTASTITDASLPGKLSAVLKGGQ